MFLASVSHLMFLVHLTIVKKKNEKSNSFSYYLKVISYIVPCVKLTITSPKDLIDYSRNRYI